MDTETIVAQESTVEETKINNTEKNEVEVQENQQETNWKKFREQREIDRREREAAEKRAKEKEAEAQALKAAMEAILNKQTPVQQQSYGNQYSSDEELSEDDRIQKKVEAAIAVKEKQYEETRRQKEYQEYPQKLNSEYKDFNQVCSTDNLDYLEYHFPEVANAFKHVPDGYDKWANIYKAVKRFVPNLDSKKEAKKAESNFNKPQSMAVPGATPTGDTAPIMLDDKRRADNWARMQKVMKGSR
jgi:hypothetical protein